MMRFLSIVSICAVLCAVAVMGCGGPQKTSLRMSFEKGTSRTVVLTVQDTQKMNMMGMAIENGSTREIHFTFDVSDVDANGAAYVEATIDAYDMSAFGTVGGEAMPMQDVGALKDAFGSLRGHAFTLKLHPDGRVTDVTGMDEAVPQVAEKMMGAGEIDVPPAAKEGLGAILRAQVGNAGMARLLTAHFAVYPTEPVGAEDAWSTEATEVSVVSHVPLRMTKNFKFSPTADGSVVLDVASTSVYDESGENPMAEMVGQLGGDMSIELNGTGTGSVSLDPETGWIRKSTLNSTSQGTMRIGQQAMDSTLTTFSSLEVL
jgi:uncharacterized protein DUF6263